MPSPAHMKKKRSNQALVELSAAADQIAAGGVPGDLDILGRDLIELPAAEVAAHLDTIKAQLSPEAWEAVRKAALGLFAAHAIPAPAILEE
jgi:hypothetical protein